jgi:hypothetical protein
MLKRTLITFAILILIFNVFFVSYNYLWPFIDKSGQIETGEYRELRIGNREEDVSHVTINPIYKTKLKIVGFIDLTGKTKLVF